MYECSRTKPGLGFFVDARPIKFQAAIRLISLSPLAFGYFLDQIPLLYREVAENLTAICTEGLNDGQAQSS